jgi:sugar lactone lactonase YvrE
MSVGLYLCCLVTALLLLGGRIAQSEGKPKLQDEFLKLHSEAQQVYQEGYFGRYRELSYELLRISPNNPRAIYQYARALALTKQKRESLRFLNRVARLGAVALLSIGDDEAFKDLLGESDFEDLMHLAENNLRPINNSVTAFVLSEKDLIPEGVAYDSVDEMLYISSIYRRKIVSISRDGKVSDFTHEKQDGLLSVLGMAVDETRRHLWVCSAWDRRSKIVDVQELEKTPSSVHKYDLGTGKLISKYTSSDPENSFFNDLTVNNAGDVVLTDMGNGAVYWISALGGELELFSSSLDLLFPNGIALSQDEKELFVADYRGIYKIKTETKESRQLVCENNITSASIDGLSFYKNSLIAHQGSTLGGVFLYVLNSSRDKIIGRKVIELRNPIFDFPTTGEIAGDTYYFIANAQLRKFNQDGSIFELNKLKKVHIMKADLSQLQ